ncbi:MAG: hypothetical protein ACW98D_17510, partial [Promethearchaeota archaeon]
AKGGSTYAEGGEIEYSTPIEEISDNVLIGIGNTAYLTTGVVNKNMYEVVDVLSKKPISFKKGTKVMVFASVFQFDNKKGNKRFKTKDEAASTYANGGEVDYSDPIIQMDIEKANKEAKDKGEIWVVVYDEKSNSKTEAMSYDFYNKNKKTFSSDVRLIHITDDSVLFAKGGSTKKFPIAVTRRIDEINEMLPKVLDSKEFAGGYQGSTMYSYVILEKPIEVKNQFVYIHGEKSKYNYDFEKRYNVNDTDEFSYDGKKALLYDLGVIKKAFTKLLKEDEEMANLGYSPTYADGGEVDMTNNKLYDFIQNTASSGMIANLTNFSNYDDISVIRALALQKIRDVEKSGVFEKGEGFTDIDMFDRVIKDSGMEYENNLEILKQNGYSKEEAMKHIRNNASFSDGGSTKKNTITPSDSKISERYDSIRMMKGVDKMFETYYKDLEKTKGLNDLIDLKVDFKNYESHTVGNGGLYNVEEVKVFEKKKLNKKFKGNFEKVKDYIIKDEYREDEYINSYAKGGMVQKLKVDKCINNGKISCDDLEKICGHKPKYPKQTVGRMTFEKCFLSPYYKVVKK